MADSIQSLGVAGGFRTTPTFDLGDLKPIDPNARETLGGFAEPTTEDAGGAKSIDLTARAKLGGFKNPEDAFDAAPPEADPANQFDAVDDLDARTVEDLDKDRDNFDPVSYLDANPDVANSPERLKKLLDIRRLRDKEGLIASRVVKAAVKDPVGAVKKFGAGVRDFGANVIDVALQPTANVVLGAAAGDLTDPQRRAALFSQTRKDLKKSVAEIDAAAESEAVGTVDLGRQGLRKAAALPGIEARGGIEGLGIGEVGEKFVPKKEKTDQDLLQEISDDVAFRKQASEVLSGEGEMAKKFGLDQTTLAKEGITLDKEAIESISLVGPLTMVASAGVYTLVSAGGKVLATARSLEGIQKASAGLKNIANAAIGRPIQLAGKLTTFAGESVRNPALISMGTMGSLMSGNPAPIAQALAAQAIGKGAEIIGPKIKAAGAKIATEGSVAVNALSELAGAGLKVAEGPALGALTSAPLAAMTDDDNAAGSILGAGIAFGGAAKGFQVVSSAPAKALFGPNRKPIADVPSAAYGRDVALDLVHQENIAKLPVADRAEVNNFRELVRPGGGEIYSVDRATYRKAIADTLAAETGKELTPEALNNYERTHAFFDKAGPGGEKIVYLNADIKGLQHDSGHIFDALLQEDKRKELRAAVKKAFSEDDINAFKERYQKDLGSKITEEAVINEFVAEQFSAIFNAVPVTELAAPKTLLSKFGNAVAEQAEKWGVDLTGGATTPDLKAPVSVGIRTMFRDAARAVAKGETPVPTPPNVVAFPGAEVPKTPPTTPEPPAPTTPVSPISDVTPAPTFPIAGTTAPNIRVTKAQQDSFSHRNAETGIARARELAASDPVVAARVEEISASLEQGNPVLEINHLGIVSEQPAAGRRTRVGEQEAGYAELDRLQIENRAEAPASVVATHSKTFVPVRWTEQGGTPTLVAVSLDKTIANVRRLAKEAVGKGVDDLIPYKMEDGKFTDDAWTKIIEDSKTYAENHANGYRGDGKKLVRPAADVGLSIPSENPNYTPKILSDEVMNFQNLLQGLNTPATAREVRGQIPANIKSQVLASANQRTLLEPAAIRPRNAGKQEFASFPGRTVKETNPLRNSLVAKGVNVDSLLPVVERLRAKDIVSVKQRPELGFKAPVTDIVRGGFLPAPTEFRTKSLGGRTVEEFAKYVLDAPFDEWVAATKNMTGGQTGGSWNLALGLTDRADLAVLKNYQELASAKTKELMQTIKDAGGEVPDSVWSEAQATSTKAMFFREAWEAAQGIGSAGAAFKTGKMGFEESKIKIPFPAEEKPK